MKSCINKNGAKIKKVASLKHNQSYMGRSWLIILLTVTLLLMNTSWAYAATTTLNPSADGSNTQWTWSGSGNYTNWQSDDSDTTYASITQGNKVQSVNLDNASLLGSINSVTVYAKARQTTGNEYLQLAIRSGGTNYFSSSTGQVATTYTEYSNAWTTNPNTGAAWTWSAIDALEAGVKSIPSAGWGGEMLVTKVWVVVDYTPPYISSLTANNAPNLGDTITVNCTLQNTDASSNITGSSVDYFMFIDADGDYTPDVGETYITPSGGSGTYASSWETTQQTKQTTSITVNASSSYADTWNITNTNFPSISTYTIYAKWMNSSGGTIDTEYTTFTSVPTLGWPLLFLAASFFVGMLVKRGVLRVRVA